MEINHNKHIAAIEYTWGIYTTHIHLVLMPCHQTKTEFHYIISIWWSTAVASHSVCLHQSSGQRERTLYAFWRFRVPEFSREFVR